jgi:hypothetical protein
MNSLVSQRYLKVMTVEKAAGTYVIGCVCERIDGIEVCVSEPRIIRFVARSVHQHLLAAPEVKAARKAILSLPGRVQDALAGYESLIVSPFFQVIPSLLSADFVLASQGPRPPTR